jgi:peroxiredoxin
MRSFKYPTRLIYTERKAMLLDTPICDFGWKAPDFTLKDPDATPYTMSQHLGEKGLLIMFICNHCPYVQAIATRLAADTRLLMDEGINVIAVMSNDYRHVQADSPANMKRFAAHHGFAFPYLVDEDQSVGRGYGAVCTPDFFGLNKRGELQYRGRLDDARMDAASERKPELVMAMRQIAQTGDGPREQFPSMGCSIKWT